MSNKTKVVIAGGGTAGWLTAYSLATRLGAVLDITLVESDSIGTVGVGEATIPTMRNFHKLMGIDEKEFMKTTQATFKLGIQFDNWGKKGDSYFHSFGEIGQRSWMAEFHEFWLEAQKHDFGGSLDDYCLELKAAKANKFCTQIGNKPVNYAYHLNATAYASFLRSKSEKIGVSRQEGKITQVINHDNGDIAKVVVNRLTPIEGDLFIDCTGFKALLIGENLGIDFEDWSHLLASDSAIAMQTESVEAPKPYTIARAHDAGWQWRIPLQSRTGNGIVYSSQFLSDDKALNTILKHTLGNKTSEPKQLKFKTGRRKKVWHKNCVAIGLSSGFLEPLESTSIHLITTAIIRLMKLFPVKSNSSNLAKQFNQETQLELETIRDFIILHYKATTRDDSEFWRFYKNMPIPDSLQHRMEIFKSNAYVWPDDVALFRVDSWIQVMMGQGLQPKSHHLGSKVLQTQQLKQQLDTFRQMINSAVAKMPEHADFVQQYCPVSSTN